MGFGDEWGHSSHVWPGLGGKDVGWGGEADYAPVDWPKGWTVSTVVRKRSQASRELSCQWVGKPWLAAPAGVPERLP